jgi:murein DD-endopeptidase MepM/ murein hydrolase activator NlpD
MLSIGGIFLLPGKTSWLLAAFATAMGLMINVLFGNTFHYFNQYTGLYSSLPVPVFAFPLNITVIIVILSLKLRLTNTKPIINDYGIFNPEKALQTFQERYRRFYTIGIPQFFLPISGKWVVTQGCNGDITHKLDWAYAWDFEIHDSTMKRYSSLEHQLSDYYSYGKPVLCSAAGYVVRVLDGVIDNEIGEVNTKENWGNYVCISHGFGLFSFYAHLKNNSITLKIGDYVKQSEKIGLVGNSGRSPFPHLHFQVQSGPEAGSKTRLSHIVNYKLHTVAEETIFVASDIPKQGDTVSSLVPEPRLQTILNLHEQTQHLFEVTTQKRVYHEVWEIRLDFYGSYTVHSNRHSDLEFSIFNGVYNALSLKEGN